MQRNRDGRAVAQDNEARILRALQRFGWLRTRDLAVLVWQRWAARPPTSGPSLRPAVATVTGLRMAQRTLKRMRERRLVLQANTPDGSVIYALAEGGARLLQQTGLPATTGKDLLRTFSASYYRHRCIANEVAIGAIMEGFRAATEREIAQGLWLGGQKGFAGKRPDVLARGSGGAIWWVEVERSRKNASDYAHLLVWLSAIRQDAFRATGSKLLDEGLRWAKIIFICTMPFRTKLCQDLIAAGWYERNLDDLLKFETVLYDFKAIKFA